MHFDTPPLNKRTLLGGQFWALGALAALTPDHLLFATLLVTVGVYLVLAPALAASRTAESSKLLLRAE